VDEVQVDVVDPELVDAAGGLSEGSRRSGWNFVVMNTSSRAMPLSRSARPTLASFPYACAVSMWRYPSSERRPDGLHALRSVRHLPQPEPEQRHHRPLGEDPAAPVGRQSADRLGRPHA
jgi:hypothetical protein